MRHVQHCEEVLDDTPLFPVSVRNNIILSKPYEEAHYQKVIDLCQLGKDLEQWDDGDSTVINTDMVNLSGGQKKEFCWPGPHTRTRQSYCLIKS